MLSTERELSKNFTQVYSYNFIAGYTPFHRIPFRRIPTPNPNPNLTPILEFGEMGFGKTGRHPIATTSWCNFVAIMIDHAHKLFD